MIKTKNIAFTLILLFTSMTVSAHRDFWVVTEFGNVKTRIKTGYHYEEIKKVQIIGELAQLLAQKLKYNEPILLDFGHYYVGITYYWRNNKYYVVYKKRNEEVLITTLNSIYDIQQKWNTIFIFETAADFLVLDADRKQIVSKKWSIQNAEKNFQPYNINHIGGDKFSISFSYYTEEPGIQPKSQILIYAKYDDKVVQDLNDIMED